MKNVLIIIAIIGFSTTSFSQNLKVNLNADGKEVDTKSGVPANTHTFNLLFEGEDGYIYRAMEWSVTLTGGGQNRGKKDFKNTNRASVATFIRAAKPGFTYTIEVNKIFKKKKDSEEKASKVAIPTVYFKVKLLSVE